MYVLVPYADVWNDIPAQKPVGHVYPVVQHVIFHFRSRFLSSMKKISILGLCIGIFIKGRSKVDSCPPEFNEYEDVFCRLPVIYSWQRIVREIFFCRYCIFIIPKLFRHVSGNCLLVAPGLELPVKRTVIIPNRAILSLTKRPHPRPVLATS